MKHGFFINLSRSEKDSQQWCSGGNVTFGGHQLHLGRIAPGPVAGGGDAALGSVHVGCDVAHARSLTAAHVLGEQKLGLDRWLCAL